MKNNPALLGFFLLLLSSVCLQAQSNIQQSLSVNSSGAAADASAQLDVSATDKGMLVPRMTSAQRTAIALPATGLLVFDTDSNGFWFYNGVGWASISASRQLIDTDLDTKIQIEENPDEDIIRFDLAGTENMVLRKNAGGSPRLELHNLLSNTFVGMNAGNATSTGSANTGLGTDALAVNSTGESNTAVGRSSLLANTTGSNNVAIGDRTLFANSTGSTNVAMGATTMLANTTGSHNTAIGTGALPKNTTGYSNTAIGRRALFNSVFSSNLVAVGDSALFSSVSGSENVALGSKALFANTTGDANTATGFQALTANTTGISNTANGVQALLSNTTGNYNTASGSFSLYFNTTGSNNTAVGQGSMNSNTIGNSNTATGDGSMYNTTTGSNNTSNGRDALLMNTTGGNNTALGYQSLFTNTTGSNNTAVGRGADVTSGTLTNATAIGYNAKVGASNSLVLGGTGADAVNVGIGVTNPAATLHVNGSLIAKGITDADNDTKIQVEESPDEDIIRFDLGGTEYMSLVKNASGQARLELNNAMNNTFVGDGAGNANTTGFSLAAVGFNALTNTTTGFGNTASGNEALFSNTTGAGNTASGSRALFSNTTGGGNTASGIEALFSSTTGISNTGVGQWALFSNTAGSGNTGLGYDTNVSSGGFQNATAVGSATTVNSSFKVRIGNPNVTVIEGQVDWTFPSDARFKFNIHDDAVPGLAFIEKLRPVTYQFDTRKFDEHLMQNMPDSIQQRRMKEQDYSKSTALVQTGFLAQEVEQACKDLNFTFSGLHVPESEVDNYGLAYGSFVPLLVKSIQEQQAIIQKLEAENASLKARDKQQAAQLDKITAALAGAGIAVEK